MSKVVKIDLKSQECFFNLMTGHCIVEGCVCKHTDNNPVNKKKLALKFNKNQNEFLPTTENPSSQKEQPKKGLKTQSTEFKVTHTTPDAAPKPAPQPK